MKKYPIHIANQMNEPNKLKQRVFMIYQEASSRLKLFNYSYLIMLVVLVYSLLVFRNQVNNWLWQADFQVANNMTELQPIAENGVFFPNELFVLKSQSLDIEMKKNAYVGFGFPETEAGVYMQVQLLDNRGRLIATNVKEGKTYFGFKFHVPKTGTYTLKALDFRPNQFVNFVSEAKELRKIKEFIITQQNSRQQIALKKGEVYRFSVISHKADKFCNLTLYNGRQAIASNIKGGKARFGFSYKCTQDNVYTLDLQSDNAPTTIGVYVFPQK